MVSVSYCETELVWFKCQSNKPTCQGRNKFYVSSTYPHPFLYSSLTRSTEMKSLSFKSQFPVILNKETGLHTTYTLWFDTHICTASSLNITGGMLESAKLWGEGSGKEGVYLFLALVGLQILYLKWAFKFTKNPVLHSH